MKAIRAHNALLKMVKKENEQLSALKQQEAFIANRHKFAKKLLSPNIAATINLDSKAQIATFKGAFSEGALPVYLVFRKSTKTLKC